MTVKKRKIVRKRRPSLADDLQLTISALNDKKTISDLEQRCLKVERDYADLRQRIVKFLRPEQVEAAKVCGCTPEIYALEWFEICKDTLRQYTPSFANFDKNQAEVQPLSILKRGY